MACCCSRQPSDLRPCSVRLLSPTLQPAAPTRAGSTTWPVCTHSHLSFPPPPCFHAAGSFYEGWGHSLASGDVEAALSGPDCECVLEGEVKMGGQVGSSVTDGGCIIMLF